MARRTIPTILLALCACGPGERPGGGDDAPQPDGSTGPVIDAAGVVDAPLMELSPDADIPSCAEAVYTAAQKPAAMMVVLDRSASMATGNKWAFASQALVQAMDKDVFDSVHLGLFAAPTGTVTGPACVFNLPVACQVPPFPQFDPELAGASKSNAPSGIRRNIKDWLSGNPPSGGLFEPDGSPLYDGLTVAAAALAAWPVDGVRILLIVTDGSLSCAEFSSRAGFADCNGCSHDWEHPQNLVDKLQALRTDPSAPILSFVVGVPGADTFDSSGCDYPPYHMRAALSAMAYAGAPDLTPSCNGTSFTQGSPDPTMPCHFDMTTPGSFTPAALAEVIAKVRGEAVGCVFEMPEPPMGQTIDPNQVNVTTTTDGASTSIGKRADPSNPCAAAPGCWDYTPGGDIELVGAACEAIKAAGSVEVKIIVGCETEIVQ